MRLLWLLPKVAPALLRHLAAYVELALLDIEKVQREIKTSLVTFAAVGVSLFFALLMGCITVIALTWDTPRRVLAIACMGGGFLVIALGAVIYRSSAVRDETPVLDAVRQQWHQDRVLLERLLAEEKEHP